MDVGTEKQICKVYILFLHAKSMKHPFPRFSKYFKEELGLKSLRTVRFINSVNV